MQMFGFRHLRQKQSVVLVVSFTNPQEGRCPAKTFFTRSTKRRTRRWSLSLGGRKPLHRVTTFPATLRIRHAPRGSGSDSVSQFCESFVSALNLLFADTPTFMYPLGRVTSISRYKIRLTRRWSLSFTRFAPCAPFINQKAKKGKKNQCINRTHMCVLFTSVVSV